MIRSIASRRPLLAATLLFSLVIGACAPATPGAAPATSAQPSAESVRPKTRVVVATSAELENLASKMEGKADAADTNWVVNSALAVLDVDGNALPRLATDLPSRDKGTWIVNADGTMATTWTIRANALWHDGQPVVSDDFVFALKIYQDPGLPVQLRDPERLMDRIEPVDSKTFTIYWKQPYPFAYRLINRELEPLPAHVLGPLYDAGDKEALMNAPFWNTPAYISNGPFRLEKWDRGDQLIFSAFDQYYLGRPGIDEVVMKIVPDGNVLIAGLLAGTIDTTGSGQVALSIDGAGAVRAQWDKTGEGGLIYLPNAPGYIEIQHDPARMGQSAMQDVRVRRAIAHAIDRNTIAEQLSEGGLPTGDGVMGMAPTEPLYARVEQAITKYAYDPNQALGLLQDAGWTKLGSTIVNAAGEPFSLGVWAMRPGRDNEAQMTAVASQLSDLGIKADYQVIPAARASDAQYHASFPGLTNSGTSLRTPSSLQRMTSTQCPTAENRYTGTNWGCWQNAEYDRFYRQAIATLDEEERAQATIGAYKALADDVGFIWLYYTVQRTPIRHGLVGPLGRSAGSGNTWNIHEWKWTTG